MGAREGCYMTNCTDWDYVNVRDFDWLGNYWQTQGHGPATDLADRTQWLGKELKNALDLEIAELDADASKFFKSVHLQQYRAGFGFLDKE
jgi:hypothetical protein